MADSNMTSIEEPSAVEGAARVPRRFWWLKRILLGVAVLLVVLAGLRWGWGVVAHRRLQAEIDRIRAAGEPLLPSDFDAPPVRDDENAAIALKKAAELITLSGLTLEPPLKSPADAAYWADVRKCIEANAEALALIRKARSLPGVDWGVKVRSPMINTMLPTLADQRALAKTLCAVAMYQHRTGDDAAAVETLRDVLAQGTTVGKQNPFIIPHLVNLAISTLACDTLERVVPDLVVSHSASATRGADRPASHAQAIALITELLDVTGIQDGQVRGFYGERASLLDTTQLAASGIAGINALVAGIGVAGPPPPRDRISFLLRPMFELDGARMLRNCRAWIEAARATNWPAADKMLPADPSPRKGLELATQFLSALLTPSLGRAVVLHHRAVASRRLAATALAIRLYELDHARRPTKLEELVPDYVPAIPLDPFATGDRPIQYIPDAERPILYNVGVNGVDENGAYDIRATGGVDFDAKDLPFFLDGRGPTEE